MQIYTREPGKEQPCWNFGVFRVRLPFLHYRVESSEALQAILMCATCLGAIPLLTGVLGIPYELAWSMVIVNGLLYNLHSVLGDPVVPGWITPSIPLTVAYLTIFPMGPERIQALIALQLLVAVIFLFMGGTGLARKLMRVVPDSIKSGILLGAGSAAIIGEFATEKFGGKIGRFNLFPYSIAIGTILSFFLLFSERFKAMRKKSKIIDAFGKYGMLPAIFASIIIAPLAGELPFPEITFDSLIKIPEFSNILNQVSVFGVGFPRVELFVKAIPMAIMVYIIAFGDFVTSGELLKEADEIRTDETIDFNSNRSNLISGIRNLIQGFFVPYVPLCGPLWAAVSAAVFERYKEVELDENGEEVRTGEGSVTCCATYGTTPIKKVSMESVYSGVGTFRWTTFLCVMIAPIVALVKPTLPVALSLTLLVQGFVCTRLAMMICKDKLDMGIAGVMGAVIVIKGAAWGLGVGILLFLLLQVNKKTDEADA
ncbi:MAG: hypothetical protein KGV57_00780 [Fusobacterium sp.]|nr:hypothetical protein [Fusobacterium sp.]